MKPQNLYIYLYYIPLLLPYSLRKISYYYQSRQQGKTGSICKDIGYDWCYLWCGVLYRFSCLWGISLEVALYKLMIMITITVSSLCLSMEQLQVVELIAGLKIPGWLQPYSYFWALENTCYNKGKTLMALC